MYTPTPEKMSCLQNNLALLRKITGWTAEEFASYLDVTRQTISNLETGKIKMTKIYYLAILQIFNHAIKTEHNTTLGWVLGIMIYQENTNEKEIAIIKEIIQNSFNSVGKRAGNKAASNLACDAISKYREV